MNFALNVSIKVERILQRLVADATQGKVDIGWIDSYEEEQLYNQAFSEVLANDRHAKASGNIRVGEIILIVDSDTRVVSMLSSFRPMR